MIKGIIFDFNRTLFDPNRNELVNGATEVLENLSKKAKMCIVSGGDGSRLETINSLGIGRFFIKIKVVSKEVGKSESDFQECLDVMNISAEETLVVGDRVEGEIKIGNKMGMKTVWFRFGKHSNTFPKSDEEEPDYEVSNLKEIYKHVSANKIQAIVDDLFFSTKIAETAKNLGVDVGFSKDLDADLFIIDLNIESIDPIETIREIKKNKASKVIGFLSHTQHELKEKAEIVGCDIVIPRSVFSEQLQKILKRK